MDKDFDLDAVFAEAAEVRMTPSPELEARILRDAVLAQPKPRAWPQPIAPKPFSDTPPRGFLGWFTGLSEVLGGIRVLAGLSLAGMTGLYLGVAQPDLVQPLTALVPAGNTAVEQIDLLPATSTLWTEN